MPGERNLLAELLQAVDLLTKKKVDVVLQENDEDKWVTRIESDGLLMQLREAVISSLGSHPVGGALPNQRSVIDGDAMEKYEKLCQEIKKLYGRVTSARPFRFPEQNLRHWYIETANSYRSGRLSETALADSVHLLESWVKLIDEKLNPPQILEITSPCPKCGNLKVQNDQNEIVMAISLIFRPGTSHSLQGTKAVCNFCHYEWRGATGVRQLRVLLDEKENISVDG